MFEVAVLVHGVDWELDEASFDLTPSIKVCRVEASTVGQLYQRLTHIDGLDDSEPINYGCFFTFADPGLLGYPLLEADSVIPRVLTMSAIVGGRPMGFCRAIFSEDDFRTGRSDTLVGFTRFAEDFDQEVGWIVVNADFRERLRAAWSITDARGPGRLSNALSFFGHACFATEFEVVCLNLAIVFETLCAPHSQSELSHQIAFNAAHLLADSPSTKREVFARLKRFYTVRSKVVHGGSPSFAEVRPAAKEAFGLAARLLQRILNDPKLAATIDDEPERRELLMRFMFPP